MTSRSGSASHLAQRAPRGSVFWWRVRLAVSAAAVLAFAVFIWAAWDQQAVMAWKKEAGPLRFFGAMAVLPALGVPTTPLFLLAGATFGRTLGLLGSAVALALNLALCHWIAGSGLRPRIKRFLSRFEYELPDFTTNRGALRFTVLVKVTPGLPAAAKNYVLGISAVPFPTYFIAGMILTGAYGAALVVLGESLLEHDARQALWAVVLLAVPAGILWWWRKKHRTAK